MNVFKEAQIARADPEGVTADRGGNGELQVAGGFVPVVRDKHPASRLVDGENGTVLVKDRDRGVICKFNPVRSGHVGKLSKNAGLNKRMDRSWSLLEEANVS